MVWFIISLALAFTILVVALALRPRRDPLAEVSMLLRQGAYNEALRALQSLEGDITREPLYLYYMGRTYLRLNNYKSAADYLHRVYRSGKFGGEIDRFEMLKVLAFLYYRLEKKAHAFFFFYELQKIDPDDIDANQHLGFMSIGSERFEYARRYLKKAVHLLPGDTATRLALAVTYWMLDEKKEAGEVLSDVIRLEPDSVLALLFSGVIQYEKEENEKAEPFFRRALENIGPDTDPYLKLILLRLLVGVKFRVEDFPAAVEILTQIIEMCRENLWKEELLDALYNRAVLQIAINELEAAHDSLLDIEAEDPQYRNVENLSSFRHDLEDGLARLNHKTPYDFDFQEELALFPVEEIPEDFFYQVSGLALPHPLEVERIMDYGLNEAEMTESGGYQNYLEHFNTASHEELKTIGLGILKNLGYDLREELTVEEGVDFLAARQGGEGALTLFRVRQWPDKTISDIYVTNTSSRAREFKAADAVLIASAEVSPDARTAQRKEPRVRIISGNDLNQLLGSILESTA